MRQLERSATGRRDLTCNGTQVEAVAVALRAMSPGGTRADAPEGELVMAETSGLNPVAMIGPGSWQMRKTTVLERNSACTVVPGVLVGSVETRESQRK